MRRPSASREALSSSNSALPRPLSSSSRRNLHSVVASGDSPHPTNALTALESVTASSAPSSDRSKATWTAYMRSIVPRGTGGLPPPALG